MTYKFRQKAIRAVEAVAKIYQGAEVVTPFMAALFSKCSIFLRSSHGKGKNVLAETAAAVTGASYGRVQGTPGLQESNFIARYDVPALLKGNETVIWRKFLTAKIKVFDEINRVPAQTLSALHTVLAEKKALYGNEEIRLDPFCFIASANPADAGNFEMYGPLMDRFDAAIEIPAPTFFEKARVLAAQNVTPEKALDEGDLDGIWDEVENIKVPMGVQLRSFAVVRDLQLCEHGDKEYLANFPACCKDCRFNNYVCSKIDARTPISERAYLSALRMVKGYAYLLGKEPSAELLVEILPHVLTHRINFLPASIREYPTKRKAVLGIINTIMTREQERNNKINGAIKNINLYRQTSDPDSQTAIKSKIEAAALNDLLVREMFEHVKNNPVAQTSAAATGAA